MNDVSAFFKADCDCVSIVLHQLSSIALPEHIREKMKDLQDLCDDFVGADGYFVPSSIDEGVDE